MIRKDNIVGIDPGLTGGIVCLSPYRGIRLKYIMEKQEGFINLQMIIVTLGLLSTKNTKVYLEKVHSMPKQGVASSFKFGRIYGAIEGLLIARGFEYELVTPQKWQKEVHTVDKKEVPNPKERSLLAVQKLFPKEDLRASDRCKIQHKGLVDALLIAEYGRRLNEK